MVPICVKCDSSTLFNIFFLSNSTLCYISNANLWGPKLAAAHSNRIGYRLDERTSKDKKKSRNISQNVLHDCPITVNRKINGSKSPSPGKHTTNLRRHYNDYPSNLINLTFFHFITISSTRFLFKFTILALTGMRVHKIGFNFFSAATRPTDSFFAHSPLRAASHASAPLCDF